MGSGVLRSRKCIHCHGPVTTGSKSGVCRTCWRELNGVCTDEGEGRYARYADAAHLADLSRKINAGVPLKNYSEVPALSGDWMAISDVHVPRHHGPTLSRLCKVARIEGIRNLAIVGDFIDWSEISRHPKPNCYEHAFVSFGIALKVLDELGRFFDRIVVLKGNHELRFQRIIEQAIVSKTTPQAILEQFDTGIVASFEYRERYESILNTAATKLGKALGLKNLNIEFYAHAMLLIDGPPGMPPYRLIHQSNGSTLPPNEAERHWKRWNQPCGTTHTHLWGIRVAPNGRDVLFNLGCGTDENIHAYHWEDPGGYPAWLRNFVAIKKGCIRNYVDNPYLTDWDEIEAKYDAAVRERRHARAA